MKAKQSLKVLYFIIPLSFILGLSWGINYKNKKLSTKIIKPSKPKLKIAAPKGLLKQSLLDDFTKQSNVEVELIPGVQDSDYIQSVIKHRNTLDLALVHRHMLPTMEKLKLTKNHTYKNLRHIISADFLNLSYDPKNKKYIPFAWNFYEVAYDTSEYTKSDINLESLLKKSDRQKLVDFNFIETYFILKKIELISDEWIKTQREDLIQSALKRLLKTAEFKNIGNINDLGDKYEWIYTSHVRAQEILNAKDNWSSEIVKEKANINILLWATLKKNSKTQAFINYMHQHHESILKSTEYASVFKSSNLPTYQQASYIRKRSLLKLEMTNSPHIMEGIWSQSYKSIMPLDKQTNASNIANY